jgi:hypothetical protein
MPNIAVIDEREVSITPVFKVLNLENIPKSEAAGYPVREMHEVVEVRFAGTTKFSPVFPADAMYRREGHKVITYAERWADQYQAFKEGQPQEAMGTPLEILRQYGITPELISICTALKIYSVEALHRLEGAQLKTLGMNQNRLKEAAAKFMASQSAGVSTFNEIEALKAEIAALKAAAAPIPAEETPPEVIAEMVAAADANFANMDDTAIKDEIAQLTGTRPRGNPSRATLESMLRDLQQEQAA